MVLAVLWVLAASACGQTPPTGIFGEAGELPGAGGANPVGGVVGGATAGAAGAVPGAQPAVARGPNPDGSWPGECVEKWNVGEVYHPPGYDSSSVHGLAAKLQEENCKNCHSEQLTGCAGAPSCNGCHDGGHPDGWRENCTYCHGGLDNTSGAPPNDLDPTTAPDAISFTAHTTHQAADTHPEFGCEHCHTKPTDILSPGHMFDDTPTVAEVTLLAGLSPAGTYDGTGGASCANLYCHGDGLVTGDYAVLDGETTCETCHATVAYKELSFDHKRHIDAERKLGDITCASCHTNMDVDGNLIDPSTHVNGTIEVVMEGVEYDPVTKSCNGTCHTLYPHGGGIWEYEEPPPLFGP